MLQKPKKTKSEVLGRELCEAFMVANIPWTKLVNNRLKNFLETNLGITSPHRGRSTWVTAMRTSCLTWRTLICELE